MKRFRICAIVHPTWNGYHVEAGGVIGPECYHTRGADRSDQHAKTDFDVKHAWSTSPPNHAIKSNLCSLVHVLPQLRRKLKLFSDGCQRWKHPSYLSGSDKLREVILISLFGLRRFCVCQSWSNSVSQTRTGFETPSGGKSLHNLVGLGTREIKIIEVMQHVTELCKCVQLKCFFPRKNIKRFPHILLKLRIWPHVICMYRIR